MINVNNISTRYKTHSTWAGTFKCRPERYFQPSNVSEIKLIVEQAKLYDKTIMVTGAGHSPSDITMTRDWLVNLDKFNRVISVDEHSSGAFTDVTVEAGMRIFELNEILKQKGLALQNLGSISDQSIAGIISTGTHGSTAFHGLVSQQVVDLTLLVASGDLIKCSPQKNLELFRAGLLSLGKLGIITHVTVRAIPAYNLEAIEEIIPFDTFLNLWPDIWTSSEYVRFWWYPYSKQVVYWRANKTTRKAGQKPQLSYIDKIIYEACLWFAVHFTPSLTAPIERWAFNKQYKDTPSFGNGTALVYESANGHNMDCLFSQFVNEWALPLTDGIRVLKELEQIINHGAETNDFYVHAPFEIRASNCTYTGSIQDIESIPEIKNPKGPICGNSLRPLLDPSPILPHAQGDDVTQHNISLYLNATMYRPFGFNCTVDKWYAVFEEVMLSAGGRPHWGKNFVGKATNATGEVGLKHIIEKWYGANLTLFKNLRKECDPTGVFLSGTEWARRNGIVD